MWLAQSPRSGKCRTECLYQARTLCTWQSTLCQALLGFCVWFAPPSTSTSSRMAHRSLRALLMTLHSLPCGGSSSGQEMLGGSAAWTQTHVAQAVANSRALSTCQPSSTVAAAASRTAQSSANEVIGRHTSGSAEPPQTTDTHSNLVTDSDTVYLVTLATGTRFL